MSNPYSDPRQSQPMSNLSEKPTLHSDLDAVHKVAEQLDNELRTLGARLEPLLQIASPDKMHPGAPINAEIVSPLRSGVIILRHRLEDSRLILADIHRRLEL